MSTPTELSFEEILKFMIAHNGKVTNHELVKHFKVFLMNPDMRDEARNTFKKHVNTLAIIKNQNNEKWLILKKKYLPSSGKEIENSSNKVPDTHSVATTESAVELVQPPYRPPPPVQLNQDLSIISSLIHDSRPLPETPPFTETPLNESKESIASVPEDIPPKVHPRRKSSDKVNEKRTSIPMQSGQRSSISSQDESMPLTLSTSKSESMLVDNEQTISVKERKQMFNRMASESDVLKSNKTFTQGADEEDRASLDPKSENDPLDSKQKQWILWAARGDYHTLAKMCKENPKLAKTKDPFTTAMHWACKRGDENLVKLLAGVARHVVNERSGYTPLHIAMQFRHENVFRLLVEVYDADPNVRDWSGRKPRQYFHMDTMLSPGSYRKADSLDLRRPVTSPPTIKITPHEIHTQPSNQHSPSPTSQSEGERTLGLYWFPADDVLSFDFSMKRISEEILKCLQRPKKESFLRIGSLNVRVKKTTEAFSNFLGVGATRSSAYMPKIRDRDMDRRSDDGDQLHKSWGSADNIQKDDKLMPPPMSGKVKRRGASGRKGQTAHSRSTPSTPDQPRAQIGGSEEGDSDSDSAAGFHSAWRQQRASCS